jgi:hypothetical protein
VAFTDLSQAGFCGADGAGLAFVFAFGRGGGAVGRGAAAVGTATVGAGAEIVAASGCEGPSAHLTTTQQMKMNPRIVLTGPGLSGAAGAGTAPMAPGAMGALFPTRLRYWRPPADALS